MDAAGSIFSNFVFILTEVQKTKMFCFFCVGKKYWVFIT